MLEVIVGLVGVAFIYAYLYANSPKENTWFKILSLFLCLFSIVILSWAMVYGQSVTYFYSYDAALGVLNLNGTQNTTISGNMQPVMTTYFSANMWVVVLMTFIVVILFLFNLFSEFKTNREQKGL